ncbi:PRC-barrel domain containing protein [Sphingopyxis granuli]|uniref:PRC-barrel domain containing protein n=1 Tax=Sphingopyxis granuli TaxID=267128 RepID=UPI001BAEB47D|nr:PRC-barrel domain containing protein [Sphingopyxis granuli]QUM70780.1 PRC-barrel domain containing protein [Sphingopyxis granuli]
MRMILTLAAPAILLAACSDKNDAAEDKLERSAETSATVAGPVPAALGLSEAQLLDADIIGADGKELGDVAKVERGADNKVDRLLVELDGAGPDRYVHVPITGLKVVVRGDDTDLQTSMTKADLANLPEVKLPPA